MSEKKIFLSVIILDFFKAKKVVQNVHSLLEQSISDHIEIVIIDNSCDEKNFLILKILEKFSQVKLLKCSQNIGYSKGNNFGVSHASGKFLAIVNPDIVWTEKKSLEMMIYILQKNSDIGIIGPQQKEISGQWAMNVRQFPNIFLQITRRIFLRNIPPFKQWVEKDEMKNMDKTKSQDVDWLQSSCYVLSKKLWDTLGGFDENYFLFLADTQMCLESWKQKKRVYFYADTQVQADGLRCSEGGFLTFFQKKSLRIHCLDALKYLWKNK